MTVKINGKDESFSVAHMTVEELLEAHNVKMPDTVTVELNGTIIRRNLYSETSVQDGDSVEFLYFMGGG
ncbi:sulfur carrier protein ThiS [Spirochaetia bacterium 38H-sp]|uniref:Sulfur carrier protein ThiS n=1 Tax=Rarispira pelagica TaxID=3141764 RepID=A0ABU9U9S3_9SPIR